MSPKVAVKLLNQYFSKMHDIIEKHNGHILNYIGDSIMIFFGDPTTKGPEEDAKICVEMVVEMLEKIISAGIKEGSIATREIVDD